MYRTHRCSVHVASCMSIYGYGTSSYARTLCSIYAWTHLVLRKSRLECRLRIGSAQFYFLFCRTTGTGNTYHISAFSSDRGSRPSHHITSGSVKAVDIQIGTHEKSQGPLAWLHHVRIQAVQAVDKRVSTSWAQAACFPFFRSDDRLSCLFSSYTCSTSRISYSQTLVHNSCITRE